jgi:hypothetical protein
VARAAPEDPGAPGDLAAAARDMRQVLLALG